jgi:hypothetical protein
MNPATSHDVTFGSRSRETANDDEGALRQQELVNEVCGYVFGSWLIWFPSR